LVTKSSKLSLQRATKFVLASAVIFSNNAGAAIVLEHSGTVKIGTDYHSNIQFLNDKQAESVYIYSIVPEYKISVLDDKNKWYGSVGVSLERSSNKTISDDREDPFGKIGWQRELESGKLGLVADYSKQSSRTSQFTETGVLAADGSTVAKSIEAEWLYSISPKLDLTTTAGYNESTFSGVSELSDYNTKEVGVELMYILNERVKPYASILATDYKANGVLDSNRIRYQTYRFGTDVTLNPNFGFNASAGMVQFNSSSQDEWIAGLSTTYTGNRYALTGTLERTVYPTGLSRIDVGDRLKADYSYSLSEKSAFGVGLGLTQNNSDLKTQDFTGFYDRDLTRSWLMHVAVGARYSKSPGQESVDDTSVGIFFTYTSPKF
jgi:hypothetical protein